MNEIEEQKEIERREKKHIVGETATIAWSQLEVFYARGAIIWVDNTMDLIEVAHALSVDNRAFVENWLAEQKLMRQFDHIAQEWAEQQTEVWAVVIKPWILVQAIAAH